MLYDKKLPSLKDKLRENALDTEEQGKTAKKVTKAPKVESKKSKKSKKK